MKVIDLFCGCGGLSLGFQNAGYEIVAAFDKWDKAIDVYKENFYHPTYLQDIKNESSILKTLEKYTFDMIIGGTPCQDFSSAGKRNDDGERANLTYNFANIISTTKPNFFVLENVEQILKSTILSKIINQFINIGYGLTAVILNAAYCNTPQNRKRFFLIGQKNSIHNRITPFLQERLSTHPMTIRQYLQNDLDIDYYYRHPRSYNRRGIFSLDEPSPTIRGVNRPIPKNYQKHNGDPQNITIESIRPLTTLERSYIQTFPKNFKFFGTKTDLEQMIGNAVPVNLAKHVATSILNSLQLQKIIHLDLLQNHLMLLLPQTTLKKR
jgi:DNA (cytosine-5)-methyltransferase 1